jgi:hypothetical protein
MRRLERVLTLALIFLCAAWTAGLAYLMLVFKRLPRLERENAPEPYRWPRLSVVIPARNEAEHLESALATLCSQEYPDLEIILINDRSTDNTGAIIEGLAKQDRRIRPVHIDRLPDEWLGKVHALDRGVARASGEWLLFTDADVHFAPATIKRAIAWALRQRADHLALIPRTLQRGFWLDVVVQTFGMLFLIATRAAGVNRTGSKSCVGVGAFNLVKTEMLQRTPGFEWLRLEPGDDIGLAVMIRQAGGVSRLVLAQDHLTVAWYPSIAAMFRGLEKNLFGPGCNYRWWLMILQVSGLVALAAAPWASLYMGMTRGSAPLLAAALCVLGAQMLFVLYDLKSRWKESVSRLFLSFGLAAIGAMLFSAGVKCLKNGGIQWRGTRYPLADLRRGQRVKFIDG